MYYIILQVTLVAATRLIHDGIQSIDSLALFGRLCFRTTPQLARHT